MSIKVSDELEKKIAPYVIQSQIAFYMSGMTLGSLVMTGLLRYALRKTELVGTLDLILFLQAFGTVLYYGLSRHFTDKMTKIIEAEETKNG